MSKRHCGYAPFTLDEGADTVRLPLKYFGKSPTFWWIFQFLLLDCESSEVRVHMYCREGWQYCEGHSCCCCAVWVRKYCDVTATNGGKMAQPIEDGKAEMLPIARSFFHYTTASLLHHCCVIAWFKNTSSVVPALTISALCLHILQLGDL